MILAVSLQYAPLDGTQKFSGGDETWPLMESVDVTGQASDLAPAGGRLGRILRKRAVEAKMCLVGVSDHGYQKAFLHVGLRGLAMSPIATSEKIQTQLRLEGPSRAEQHHRVSGPNVTDMVDYRWGHTRRAFAIAVLAFGGASPIARLERTGVLVRHVVALMHLKVNGGKHLQAVVPYLVLMTPQRRVLVAGLADPKLMKKVGLRLFGPSLVQLDHHIDLVLDEDAFARTRLVDHDPDRALFAQDIHQPLKVDGCSRRWGEQA